MGQLRGDKQLVDLDQARFCEIRVICAVHAKSAGSVLVWLQFQLSDHGASCRVAYRATVERPTHRQRRAALDDASKVAFRNARDRIRAYDTPVKHG